MILEDVMARKVGASRGFRVGAENVFVGFAEINTGIPWRYCGLVPSNHSKGTTITIE